MIARDEDRSAEGRRAGASKRRFGLKERNGVNVITGAFVWLIPLP
jgi:hypothetical protein